MLSCAWAPIGFMPDEADCLKAFQSMARILRPQGILILTALPTDRQWKEKPRFILKSSRHDFSRIFVVDYLAEKACYNILDVLHDGEMSDLKVWSAELRVLLRDDQERLLLKAGFRAVDFYGSFDFSPYDRESSSSLISVAHR